MTLDPLDSLLSHFRLDAELIYSGLLCGNTPAVLSEGRGHLHIIRSGCADVRHETLPVVCITEPTLLFYPRPLAHQFVTDTGSGAEFVCASIGFHAGRLNPIVQALPSMIVVRLADVPDTHAVLDLLFHEADAERYGRRATIGRLFEVILTQFLGRILEDKSMSTGMLAGLAHPHLGKALVALHEEPGQQWTLERLAGVSGMSRSRFAQDFKSTIGTTVGEYLVGLRLAFAQELLRRATPLKQIASTVGYGSPLALTRAFRTRLGVSPRAWLQTQVEMAH